MVFIVDSHPVQYKAPVYQELARLREGGFKVLYATDCSVRGHRDAGFGQKVAWDIPLLEGYPHVILGNERGEPLAGFRSLTGRGIGALLRRERPEAVLISQFLYEADLVTYIWCHFLGIPVWIRHETQDEAFVRPGWKSALRRVVYRLIYRGVDHAFYIGELNREHLIASGMAPGRMSRAAYCVRTRLDGMSDAEKQRIRDTLRGEHSVAADEVLLLFSGKLIEKKNPRLILEAMELLTPGELGRFKVLYVGSGAMEDELREMAGRFAGRVEFAGFVNQSRMHEYYLAADVLILPSRRAGETWGLVVNEALHAGCGVVMTDAVGCHREFGGWERVRVIGEGNAVECANALRELSGYARSFDWCAARMENYSVHAAAEALAEALDKAGGAGKDALA